MTDEHIEPNFCVATESGEFLEERSNNVEKLEHKKSSSQTCSVTRTGRIK